MSVKFYLLCFALLFFGLLPARMQAQYTISGDTIRNAPYDTVIYRCWTGQAIPTHVFAILPTSCCDVMISDSSGILASSSSSCTNCCVASPLKIIQPCLTLKPGSSLHGFAHTAHVSYRGWKSLIRTNFRDVIYAPGTYTYTIDYLECSINNAICPLPVTITYVVEAAPVVNHSVAYNNTNRTATATATCISNCSNVQYTWGSGQTGNTLTASSSPTRYEILRSHNASGCVSYDSVLITQQCSNTGALLAWADSDTVCAGYATELHVSAIYRATYQWSTSNTDSVVRVLPSNGWTHYMVTSTAANYCQDTASVWVYAQPLPSFHIDTVAGYPSQICEGQSTRLKIIRDANSPLLGYWWTPTNATDTIQTISGLSAGIHTIRATTSVNGCSSYDEYYLGVHHATTPIFANNGSDTICSGQSRTIAVANIDSFSRYQWSNGATTSSIVVSAAGTYMVTATTIHGCQTTATKTITIRNTITPSFSNSTTFCAGSTLNLALSDTYSSYLWSGGATSATLPVTAGGTYSVTVSNGSCTGSNTITVSSISPPTVTITTSATSVCMWQTATLTASASGTISSYLWSTGATTSSITPTLASTTSYQVTLTNSAGCVGSGSATVSVTALPTVTITPSSTSVCAGQTATLTASASGTISSYLWSTGATTSSITPTLASTTSYQVTVTNSAGCTVSSSATVSVTTSPTVTITPSSTSVCAGQTATLTASASGTISSYLWSTGATTSSITPTLASTTSYQVTVTNSAGCTVSSSATVSVTTSPTVTITPSSTSVCAGQTATLTASASGTISSYLWSTGATTSSITPTPASTTSTLASTTSYQVTITVGGGCVGSGSATVSVTAAPTVTITPSSATVCSGRTTTLTASASGTISNYLWSNGATTSSITPTLASTTSYQVTVSNAAGCAGSHSVTITSIPTPTVTISAPSTTVCAGQSTTLTANTSGTISSYAWSTAATTSSITPTISASAIYQVTVTATNGCTEVGAISLTVQPCGTNNATLAAAKDSVCTGATVQLTVSNVTNSATYLWSNSATTNAINVIPVAPSSTYTVTVVDNSITRVLSKTIAVSTITQPATILTPQGTTICNNSNVILFVTQPTSMSYAWSNGATASYISATAAGVYSVTTTIDAVTQCKAMAAVTVTEAQSITSASFYSVSSSETMIALDAVLNDLLPSALSASPRTYSSTSGGVYMSGGNYYLNANAVGVGTHPIQVNVTTNGCTVAYNATISVVAQPVIAGINHEYCNNAPVVTVQRDANFGYTTTSNAAINEMRVSATNYNGSFTNVSVSANSFTFDPSLVSAAGSSILSVYYIVRKINPQLGLIQEDTIARDTHLIRIGTAATAAIQNTNPSICASATPTPINVSPSGGTLTIRQLNGARAGIDVFSAPATATTLYAIPTDLRTAQETGNTNYTATYTYNYLGCVAQDTYNFMIPQPANVAFHTGSNRIAYCFNSPSDTLIPNTANQGGRFSYNGNTITRFPQQGLTVGQHIVSYEVQYNGCINSGQQIFTIQPLPTITPAALQQSYCNYNAPINISAQFAPTGGAGSIQVNYNGGTQTQAGNTFTLNPNFVHDTAASQRVEVVYAYTDANGCHNDSTASFFVHPRPDVQLMPLDSAYCYNASMTIPLAPSPFDANSSMTVTTLSGSGTSNFINRNTSQVAFRPATAGLKEQFVYSYTSPVTHCNRTVTRIVGVMSSTASVPSITVTPTVYCATDDTITIYGGVSGGNTANYTRRFKVSSERGLNPINTTTASFIPKDVMVDTSVRQNVVFTYEVFNSVCTQVAQQMITINPLPAINIQMDSTICEGTIKPIVVIADGMPIYSRAAITWDTATHGIRTTTTPAGVDEFYFVPDSFPASSRLGLHPIRLTYRAITSCRRTAETQIEILGSPVPTISGLAPSYCTSAIVNGIDGNTTLLPDSTRWIITPPALLTSAANSPSLNLNFNLNNTTATTASVEFRAFYNNGCVNSTQNAVNILRPAVLDVQPLSAICRGMDTVLFRGENRTISANVTASTLFRLYDNNNFIDSAFYGNALVLSRVTSNSPSYNVIATYADAMSGCTASDTTSISISTGTAPILTGGNIRAISSNVSIFDICKGSPNTFLEINNANAAHVPAYRMIDSISYLQASGNRLYISPMNAFIDTITYELRDTGTSCVVSKTLIIRCVAPPAGLQIVGLAQAGAVYCDTSNNQTANYMPIEGAPQASAFGLNSTSQMRIMQNGVQFALSGNGNTMNIPHRAGEYEVRYVVTNPFGCTDSITRPFIVHPRPVVNFTMAGLCKTDTLRLVSTASVNTPLNAQDSIYSYTWQMDNAFIGSQAICNHLLTSDGSKYVTLTVATTAGCQSSLTKNIYIHEYPQIALDASGGCSNDTVTLTVNNSRLTSTDTLTKVIWQFGDGVVDSAASNIQNNRVANRIHIYPTAGNYTATLRVTNGAHCTQSVSVPVIVSSGVQLYVHNQIYNTDSLISYFENFEGATRWLTDDSSDWRKGLALGNPMRTRNVNDPHHEVWTTSGCYNIALNDSTPRFVGEKISMLYPPCFDFSRSQRPMMKFVHNLNLASGNYLAMEYYDETARRWRRLGQKGRGVNWYNSDRLDRTGDIPTVENLDEHTWRDTTTGWITARYRLDDFVGKSNVRLRFMFAAPNLNDTITPFEGVAIDSFWVGERQNNVLVEYFTNVYYSAFPTQNNHVYGLTHNAQSFKDVALIQYHSDFNLQGADPFHAPTNETEAGVNTRFGVYGIDQFIGDGHIRVNGQYWAGAANTLTADVLETKMLEDPYFSIRGIGEDIVKVELNLTDSTARLRTIVKALRPVADTTLSVFMTMVEDSINYPNIGYLHNIFRTFVGIDEFSANTGTPHTRAWAVDDTMALDYTWNFARKNIPLFSPRRLKAVVFIQNSSALRDVYQAVATNNFDVRLTAVDEATQTAAELFGLVLYPNPTTDAATMRFDKPLSQDYGYQIYDMRGVVIQTGIARQGEQFVALQTTDLPQGMYIVTLRDKANSHYVQRKLIITK